MVSRAELDRLNRLMLAAEEAYTQEAYAKVILALEDLGDPENLEVRYRRAMATHALAELRADADLLLLTIREYEACLLGLHPKLAARMPELIAECHEQLAEARARR